MKSKYLIAALLLALVVVSIQLARASKDNSSSNNHHSMDAIEAIMTRRSCRAYEERQIEKEKLDTILNCGLQAPSAKNRQSTKIIVIQDAEKIKNLSRLNASIMGTTADPFYGAPTLCLIVAPKPQGEEAEGAAGLNVVKDGSLVIGNMLNAAHAMGLAGCWINRCEQMLEAPEGQAILAELGLDNYQGIGCCILGYPAKAPGKKTIKEGRVVFY